ncbi:MAG: hypothetical protein IPG22_02740 [Acidobacteria bacterium]|nr:hypothetical protein [Acidobacteriota bacterium]
MMNEPAVFASNNKKPFSVPSAAKFFLVLCLAISLSVACGKRGAPEPPKERVLQRVEISGYQRGSQVILSWQMPVRNAVKGNTLNISRADIYRLAEAVRMLRFNCRRKSLQIEAR